MKIVINEISKALRFGVTLIVFSIVQNAVADNIIYEGVSVPGGFYLGMSRNEVNLIDSNDLNNRNCRSGSKCSLNSPIDHDVYVSLYFTNNAVVQIETSKRGYEDTLELETTAGAMSDMSPDEVAALYPGAVIKKLSNRQTEIIVTDRGYTLLSYLRCPPYSFLGPCRHRGVHRIYEPVDGAIEDESDDLSLSNLSGKKGSYKVYKFKSSGRTKIKIFGGRGDADLYVQKGTAPTLNSYDCRPYLDGNYETCELYSPGTYYIMLRGYRRYSGLSLKAYSE